MLMTHKPLPPSITSNHLLYSQTRMVLYYIFSTCAWNFCNKLVPHQLTVILGLTSTTAAFWKFIPEKPVATLTSLMTRFCAGEDSWLARCSTSDPSTSETR